MIWPGFVNYPVHFVIKPVFLRHCYFLFARNSCRITCWALPLSIWATNWPRRVAAHNLETLRFPLSSHPDRSKYCFRIIDLPLSVPIIAALRG